MKTKFIGMIIAMGLYNFMMINSIVGVV